jgi:hypothetical protein
MTYYPVTQLDSVVDMLVEYGAFSVLMPFVLVFAVVYAILQKSKILGAKHAIDGIVAFAVAFMALRWDFMPRFFNELFPRVGMGIAILVALAILFGLFFVADIPGRERLWRNIGAVAAVIVFVVILIQTAGGQQVAGGREFWETYKGLIISGIALLAIIMWVTMSHSWDEGEKKEASK